MNLGDQIGKHEFEPLVVAGACLRDGGHEQGVEGQFRDARLAGQLVVVEGHQALALCSVSAMPAAGEHGIAPTTGQRAMRSGFS